MFKNIFRFAMVKKPKMEVTIRTPYETVLENFSGFSRIKFKSPRGIVVVQNRTASGMYVIEPGVLLVKYTETIDKPTDFMHNGGYVIIFKDNTCQMILNDIMDRKNVDASQFESNFVKSDSQVGKQIDKVREQNARYFRKKISSGI